MRNFLEGKGNHLTADDPPKRHSTTPVVPNKASQFDHTVMPDKASQFDHPRGAEQSSSQTPFDHPRGAEQNRQLRRHGQISGHTIRTADTG